MYAQLGDIIFEGLYGPEEHVRKDSVSLPQHKRINRMNKSQFTGIDNGELKLSFKLHNSFIDVEDAIERFRKYRETATHLRYITGSGTVVGTFIIKKTKEKQLHAKSNGDLIYAKLEVELIETAYSSQKNNAIQSALANRSNSPVALPIRPVPTPATLGVEAAVQISVARSSASQGSAAISAASSASASASRTATELDKAREAVITARENMADAHAKVQAFEDTVNQAQGYIANIQTAINNAQTLEQYIDGFDPLDPVGSLNNINNANTEFMSSVAVMTNTTQPLAAWTGSRR